MTKVAFLKSNVAKFLLLRACFGACRVNHLLRGLPFRHGVALARKSTALFRSATKDILGSSLRDLNFELACLPVKKGGLGIRDPGCVLSAAFLASNFTFAGTHSDLPLSFWKEMRDAWTEIRARTGLNMEILESVDFNSDNMDS